MLLSQQGNSPAINNDVVAVAIGIKQPKHGTSLVQPLPRRE